MKEIDYPIDDVSASEMKYLKKFANLLDSKFRIPGTDITFGIDPLLGLIPWLGDIIGYIFSALLLFAAFRKGVRGEILLKMLGNIGLDALVGMIPVLGTIFDFAYKANDRNYKLLNEFVEEDKHSGSGWPIILVVVGVMLLILFALIYSAYAVISWLINLVF